MPAAAFASLPPAYQVDFEPTAEAVHRGLIPGPSKTSRPFVGMMFIAHIRLGDRLNWAPAMRTVSPSFKLSGFASVRRRMLSELASMSQTVAEPLASIVRTPKWKIGR